MQRLDAGVVQRLVCKFSKLKIGVRFSAPAPYVALVAQLAKAKPVEEMSRFWSIQLCRECGACALVAQLDRAEDF